ncbi:DUF5689 domain-containing protein [Myroides sp. LJL110]
MKTILKNILYACFFALFIVSCAKNDDFTTPNVDLPCEELTATVTMAQLYGTITDKISTYENDDILEGYIISSDQGGNLYQSIYFVDENNTFSALFRADIQAYYASFPVGTKIYLKLKDLKVQINNEILTFGGHTSGNFVQTLASPTARKHIVRGCERLTPEQIMENYHSTVTLKEAVTTKYIGKLITIKDVQFQKAFWGKTFYDQDNEVSETNRATNNLIESKTDNPSPTPFFRVIQQTSGFAQELVPAKSGSMTGIMTAFLSDRQFNPRTMADLEGLKDDPFQGDDQGGETEGPDDSDKEPQGDGTDGVNQNQGKYIANFGQWNNFIASTNKFGLLGLAQQAQGQGPDGAPAMTIRGKVTSNAYLFTTENQTVPSGAKSITLKVKGTSAKSLSFNLYRNDGTYAVFNLATDAQIEAKETAIIKQDITLKATTRVQTGNTANGQNDYVRAQIDSPNNWITITLDLTGVNYNTTASGSVFAFKLGSNAYYNLTVGDIIFDGGTDTGEPETPEEPENPGGDFTGEVLGSLADFNNWEGFLATLTTHGLKNYATQAKGQAPDAKDAMLIDAKPSGNDYVFTTEKQTIPAGTKAIQFQVKGTSAKSLSMNVYKADGSYDVFNLASDAQIDAKESPSISSDVTLFATKKVNANTGSGSNNYTYGTINSPDKWITITLDLTGVDINTTQQGSLFGFKVGSGQQYNLLLSNINFIK